MDRIFSLAIVVAALAVGMALYGNVSIPTGFVGVKYTFKEAIEPLLAPGGPHFYNPFTTSIVLIETRPQTDVVTNIMCGTNDGVKIVINKGTSFDI